MATENTSKAFLGFLGTRTATLDAKGRVTFPSLLREQAPAHERERFILIKYPTKCLALYSEAGWAAISQRLEGLSQSRTDWNPEQETFIYSSAEPVTVDGMGRILIPEEHQAWAGLTKGTVVFVGSRSRVEVW